MSLLRESGVTRPDWAPARSSGALDTLIIRAANRLRGNRTDGRNQMSKYRDQLDAKGKADLDAFTAARKANPGAWLTENNEVATKDNTDPRVWDAIQTPFRTADEYR